MSSTTCGAAAGAGTFPVGAATMSPAMERADRYARYLCDCVRPWLSAPVLEIGTGFGTYTGLLLKHGRVVTSDIDAACLERVAGRYPRADLATAHVDLNDAASIRRLAGHGARSIFCSNVLEHIEDDARALRALRDVVLPGGTCCVIVPAHPRLYGFMDRAAGHFRRYTRRGLEETLRGAGWSVVRSFYVNALGGIGWWLNQRLVSPRPLDAPLIDRQLALYDRLVVPIARRIDPLFGRVFGLSVVGIARRGAEPPAEAQSEHQAA